MKKIYVIILLFINFSFTSFGQASLKDSCINMSLITISYGYQFPSGDLAKRFYSNSAIGAGYLFKTKKNWIFGADGFFMFRDKIKETDILKNISTSDGNIIDGNGLYADYNLYERGYNVGIKVGKIIPFYGPNKNSGITFLCGTGFLQHKIRIENPGNGAYQILGDYKKGYDRLTNGLSFSEFIGYTYLGNKKLLSFFAGFEFTQAFTQNRRYNFDLMGYDNTKRHDYLSGFKLGWVIPIYKQAPNKYYYY